MSKKGMRAAGNVISIVPSGHVVVIEGVCGKGLTAHAELRGHRDGAREVHLWMARMEWSARAWLMERMDTT